jgi:hypothetical protein
VNALAGLVQIVLWVCQTTPNESVEITGSAGYFPQDINRMHQLGSRPKLIRDKMIVLAKIVLNKKSLMTALNRSQCQNNECDLLSQTICRFDLYSDRRHSSNTGKKSTQETCTDGHLLTHTSQARKFATSAAFNSCSLPHGFTPFLSAVPSVPLEGSLGRYGGRFHNEFG